MLGDLKESGAFGGIMAELMTEDAESAWRVIEATGGLRRRHLIQEVGPEGFVLAVERRFGCEKELGLARIS
jgi:hypothetical protein